MHDSSGFPPREGAEDERYGIRSEGDPQLIADGWTRRFVADPGKVREAVELYAGLGFEVRAEPILPEEMADNCSGCRLLLELQFKTIYTRPVRRNISD